MTAPADDAASEFFILAADLARMEAADTLARATARAAAAPVMVGIDLAAGPDSTAIAIGRADRLRYVATLRHAFAEPAERTQEEARIAACRDAGVPPYGPL